MLSTRKYVGMDQRKGLLVRLAEETGELKEELEAKLNQLGGDIDRLKIALADFEPERYPVAKLRQQLADTTDRDELEVLKNEVRRVESGVQKYATSRAEGQREKFGRELTKLRELVQYGVPVWLSREFPPSPLQDLLEQQRKQISGSYETVLRDMRQLAAEKSAVLQTLSESPIDTIETLQKALPDLARESDKLRTRRTNYDNMKDDLESWHKAITAANTMGENTKILGMLYGTEEWQEAMDQLWRDQRTALTENPLDLPSLHRQFNRQLMSLADRLNKWLQNRREDFEKQRDDYADALNQMGIPSRLRIPYDEKNPRDSYNALVETVHQGLSNSIAELQRRLGQSLQKIRYVEQVQHVNLDDAGNRVEKLLLRIADLQQQLTIDVLGDMSRAKSEILKPLQEIAAAEDAVADSVQQALRKRGPNEREGALLRSLQALANTNEIDLYSLLVRQLDQSNEQFNLDQLMDDLQSLFQKNQIGLRIRLL